MTRDDRLPHWLGGHQPGVFFGAVAFGALPKTIGYVTLRGVLSDALSARGGFALDIGAAVSGAPIARRLLRSQPAPATA